MLYGVDVNDTRHFALTIDASRFSPDRIVETLLAAAGVSSAAATPAGMA
jgi:cytidylate kinase